MHQPSAAMQGQAADIAIQAEQIVYLKRMMAERIAFHTGQPVERIEADSDRDRWFTAEEAQEYGFIDQVIDRSAAQVGRQLSVALEAPAPPPGAGPRPRTTGRRSAVADASPMAEASAEPAGGGRTARSPGWCRPTSASGTAWSRSGGPASCCVYLVRTEIKVKYKNSFLGLIWSMLSPAMTLVVYTLVFGVFLKNGIPNFVIFLFSGLLLWNFFQTGVITATGVVVNNAGLVKKVSFPREILALASIGSAGVFFFFQSCVHGALHGRCSTWSRPGTCCGCCWWP